MNEQYYFVSILYYYSYLIFCRIGSIPYLYRIQNKEKKKVCVHYSLIYKNDVQLRRRLRKLYVTLGRRLRKLYVTLGRRLRKLYLSARTAAIFTRPSF